MCNWRFHNAVKKIDFQGDEESVEAQCRAVLKQHPQAGINTFLLEPEHISMVSRVQDALSANGSGNETLTDWCVLHSSRAAYISLLCAVNTAAPNDVHCCIPRYVHHYIRQLCRKMVSTWARDAALNDGSGIVFPPNWVNTADSFKFANFFMIMYADVLNNTLPKGFFDGVRPANLSDTSQTENRCAAQSGSWCYVA